MTKYDKNLSRTASDRKTCKINRQNYKIEQINSFKKIGGKLENRDFELKLRTKK